MPTVYQRIFSSPESSKSLTFLGLPLLLAACGTATLPANDITPTIEAQQVSQVEAQQVRAYGKACATATLIKLIENAANDYGFIPAGATCTNEFLGFDALPASKYVRSTRLAASADRTTVIELASVLRTYSYATARLLSCSNSSGVL